MITTHGQQPFITFAGDVCLLDTAQAGRADSMVLPVSWSQYGFKRCQKMMMDMELADGMISGVWQPGTTGSSSMASISRCKPTSGAHAT